MLGAIKHGLTNLLNFSGRDARQTFWYYVLFLYIVSFILSILAMIPVMVDVFSSVFEMAKAGASPEETNQAIYGKVGRMYGNIGWLGIASGIASILLLAASLVRRLHDSDMPGWWALLPGGLQVIGSALVPGQMAKMAAVMQDQAALNDPTAMYRAQGWVGLIGWAALGLVIYIGVRKSTPGPNRYGAEPVSF